MTRTTDDFLNEILALKTKTVQDTAYGANVVPIIELYKALSTYEERKAFQDALERMLCDKNQEVRSYAVNICLGFFVFRDAV
jgi:hypothetical protein